MTECILRNGKHVNSSITNIRQSNSNNYNRGNIYNPGLNSGEKTNFTGNVNGTDKAIDSFLMSKGGQKILKFASLNPTFFSLALMTALATTLRPATIMVVPGAKKEDKKYAAMKSIISASITLVTQGLIFYPLGKAMEKAGEKAKNAPNSTKFPHPIKTPKFQAFNYFTNNGVAFFTMIAASLVMVKVVAKVMNKIMPSKRPSQPTKNETGNEAQRRDK